MAVAPVFSVFPPKFIEFSLADVPRASLEIWNDSNERIGFRVMTNSRDDYLIQPCSGFIEQGEHVVCTVTLKKNGNVTNDHSFVINAYPASTEDDDRKAFWEKNKDAPISTRRLGVKLTKSNDQVNMDRLIKQVKALKAEVRSAKMTIDRQTKHIAELRDVSVQCHHPSSLIIFLLACLALVIAFVFSNGLTKNSPSLL